MIINRDASMHIVRSILSGIASDDRLAQRIHAFGHFHVIAFVLKALQNIVERAENREIGGRAGVAAIGREVEEHDADPAVFTVGAAQRYQLIDAHGQAFGAL